MARDKNRKKQTTGAQHGSAAPLPSRVELTSVPKLEVTVNREPDSDEQLNRTYGSMKPWTKFEKWSAILAGIGLVATIGSIWIYASQLTEMRKATEAATRSNQTAQLALKASQETANAQLRAWVGLVRIKLDTFSPKDGIKVTITYKNSGNTPATDMIDKSRIFFLDRGQKPDPEGEIKTIQPLHQGALFPDIERYDALGYEAKPMGGEYCEGIMRGDIVMYAVGETTYESFGPPRRATRFFYRFHPPQGDFIAEQTCNDAD